MKQTALTKAARGRDCLVRLPGICNGNSETVVLAHYRLAGICGTSIKPHDLIGAWACSACHNEIDRKTRLMDHQTARLYHLEGMVRTIDTLTREGKV